MCVLCMCVCVCAHASVYRCEFVHVCLCVQGSTKTLHHSSENQLYNLQLIFDILISK